MAQWWIYILFFVSVLCSCNVQPEYRVGETGDLLDVSVKGVEYDTALYTYYTVAKRGEPSEYVSGLQPTVVFTLTNNSDEAKLVPIPDYYYVNTEFYDKEHPESTHLDERCKCYVADQASAPQLLDGDEWRSVDDVAGSIVGGKYALHFDPHETKTFATIFYSAHIPIDEKWFKFGGFSSKNTRNGKFTDLAIKISVKDGKVKGFEYFSLKTMH